MKKQLILLLAVSMFAVFSISELSAQEMLQIKGSDTLINLVQRMSEVYMKKNPGKIIAITGGGSGTGIAALINKKCDIANASRLMKGKEMQRAAERDVKPNRVVVAIDGISVIINAKNVSTKFTLDELGKIFRGEIKNWKEVGGKDMPISLYGRQSNSGTFVFFRESILKGDYSPKMKRMNGNAQIVSAVGEDVSSIGYVGVGYVKNLKGNKISVAKVAARSGAEYTSPLNAGDVKSGKYPISRPLNQYVNGNPKGAILDFIKFELSEEGQKIVEEEGFFIVPDEYKKFNKMSVGI